MIIEDRAAAIAYAVQEAAENDVILVAGKGHEDYQLLDGKRIDFSDYGVALASLAQRAKGLS
jgi:UDP-N-acetylmuramoyl-L-alanyl-D-glutamate--2,6-diaminopimelate ligase